MVIGGFTGSDWLAQGFSDPWLAGTHIYDHYHEIWSVGPSLIQARMFHAAGIVTDEATMATYAIVTGGYYGGSLKSTEILKGDAWSSNDKKFHHFSSKGNEI